MIDRRRESDLLVELNVAGTQTAATDKACKVIPFACELIGFLAALGTAGVTGSQVVDIHKNGTTIFSKSAKITFATTVATMTAFASDETAVTSPVQFAEGDVVTLDVDSVHSGSAAVNLCVTLLFRRTGVGGIKKVSAARTGSIGTF